MSTPMTLEAMQADLDDQGFCGFLQIKAVSVDTAQGILILALPFRPDLTRDPAEGHIHGGVIGAFLDTAATYALLARGAQNCPTVNYRVDLLRPVIQSAMHAKAIVRKQGRMLATVDVDLTDDAGKLCATARATFAILDAG